MSAVAERLRVLMETPADSRHEWATDEALSDGAAEIERLAQELERVQAAQAAQAPAAPDATPTERCPIGTYASTVLGYRATPDISDITAFARREAGPVTPHQWRQCATCGRCFWLAPTEAVPAHRVTVLGVERACGWAVTVNAADEGSEGR